MTERTSKARRLFQALTVLSAIACVLLIMLWVRSYSHWDAVMGNLPGLRVVQVLSIGGKFEILISAESVRELLWDASSGPNTRGSGRLFVPNEVLGFRWQNLAGQIAVVIPYWFPVLVTATIGVLPWIKTPSSFSLRALLIATTVVAVALGIIAVAAGE